MYTNDSNELGGGRNDKDQNTRAFVVGRQIAEEDLV